LCAFLRGRIFEQKIGSLFFFLEKEGKSKQGLFSIFKHNPTAGFQGLQRTKILLKFSFLQSDGRVRYVFRGGI